MSEHRGARLSRVKTAATMLEVATPLLALMALAYRATLYWVLPASQDGSPGLGPTLDLILAMLLFATSLACAGLGVTLSLRGTAADKGHAYRAFFIGAGSFMLYELVYPYVPRLI